MRANGYAVQEIKAIADLTALKNRWQIPPELWSCHTAIVDGYVLEGHVPVADIERLLRERPDVIGLAVPGMPVGSPGMEVADSPPEPYQVIAFGKNGQRFVFAEYNP